MKSFVFQSLPSRVVFGAGVIEKLPRELETIGANKAFVLSTPGRAAIADRVATMLGAKLTGVFNGAVMHVPVAIVEKAANLAEGADVYVAIGGGSTVGLAKALALRTGRPIIAIPTTFAGSEMTPIYGLTEGGAKKTGRDARVLPRVTMYDPQLLASLPAKVAAPSAMNAIAHAVEALYAEEANPLISMIAEQSIRLLAESLPRVIARDLDAITSALEGAWLAGTCLGSVGMALHHKLCHTLGGSFGLPHAETHAVVLPHVMAFNAGAAREAAAAVARALDAEDAATGLYELAVSIGAPTSLHELGMREEDLERAAELATERPYYNPRAVERGALFALLQNAYRGIRPAEV